MQITGGGIVILLIIAVIIIGIIVINRWRSGSSMSLKGVKVNLKRQKTDDNTVFCLNIYPNKIVGEYMLKTSVCKDADIWPIGSKKPVLQGYKDGHYIKISQPDDIAYPPERLARMMGCEPLRRLKSLKFKWYEQLAPFAPVVALAIAGILFMVIT